MASALVYPQPIKAQNNDYYSYTIEADDSVTPPTASIQRIGSAYMLTSDITGIVSIQRSNIVFDENGHTLLKGEISLDGVANVTLKNFQITNTTEIGPFAGISLTNTSNCTIANNTITGIWNIMGMNAITYVGIHVKGGGSNSFTGNTLVNNMAGMIFRDSSHNMINGNDVTCGANSWNLYDNVGGILFANSSNNTIYHNNFVSHGGRSPT
jgi:parallel beta-helix repeat protein